jgi:succinate-semialdehyde dehydrogenase/glutarate-semialdehyde dehydrogenase
MPPATLEPMKAINPATGEEIESWAEDSPTEVEAALRMAEDAFRVWSRRPVRVRASQLRQVGEMLRERTTTYAELMAREMGKPVQQGREEIEKCAWVCDHFAEHAHEYLQDAYHPGPPDASVRTSYEPLGAVLAIMPWNFPFWQVFRFAVPALCAGNVGLLKHASNVPGCAMAIEELLLDAGTPEGVFQTLMIPSNDVPDVLTDDRVAAATVTGSGGAGRTVAGTAGEHLKKTVLELGGSDPFIVLEDADVETAASVGARSRIQNAGQSCIAAKRFIVHEAVYHVFVDRLVEEFDSYVIGDPTDPQTDVGPIASQELLESLHQQVRASLDAGATSLTGGRLLNRDGAFYSPTVLVDVPTGSPAATEELFGPVAAVFSVADEEEAIEMANDSRFGLGASLWSDDRDRANRIASRIEAGCVYINQLVKSDPRVPFGGVKQSGYGRELAEAGIKEFVNRKTVWIE